MMRRVSIAGASGYAGAELAALLTRHRGVEVVAVYANGEAEPSPFSALHPSLRNSVGPPVEPFSLDSLLDDAADAVFLATPHELSAEIVPRIASSVSTVIDLSGAFRLRAASQYAERYGFEHPAPDLLPDAVYGLTERAGEVLAGAKLVANPGCYPTAILLALEPIASLIAPGTAVVCDAKSGVSGAGKKSSFDYSFTELSGNFKAYGVGTHRHEPEIASRLPAAIEVVFVPHLLPVPRGILATIYVELETPVSDSQISALYAGAYGGAPFVKVHAPGTLPSLRDVVGTPRCDIGFTLLAGGRRAVVVSVIDNLLKGAASQAVQNFNRVFGFDESEGLQ